MSSDWVTPRPPRIRWNDERTRPVLEHLDHTPTGEIEISNVELRGLALDLTRYSIVSFDDCVIESCQFVTSHQTEIRIAGSMVRWSDLSGVRMSRGCTRTTFQECKLVATDFGGATTQDVSFKDSMLVDVSFRMGTLRRVEFDACQVTGLDAGDSVLEHVSCPNTSLVRISFDRAQCSAVDLSSATDLSARRVRALAGCRISVAQAIDLAVLLATECGLAVDLPSDD